MTCAIATFLFLAGRAHADSITLRAYDARGRVMTATQLRRRPGAEKSNSAGFFVTDMDGAPAGGFPWWTDVSSAAALNWTGARRVKLSAVWPTGDDTLSTLTVDNAGDGYYDGQSVLLNEELAKSQFHQFNESLRDRKTLWAPPYTPSAEVLKLQKEAKELIAQPPGKESGAERAARFDASLKKTNAAWLKMIVDYGRQSAHILPKDSPPRFGLTLDETMLLYLNEYPEVRDALKHSGANWVRLVFPQNPSDFLYERARSFNEYDKIVADLKHDGISILGSALDSSLWPSNLTSSGMTKRTRNLVEHYKDSIRSWEVASEPNGSWLGGAKKPLALDVVRKAAADAAAEVRKIDPMIETVATLYWWQGNADAPANALLPWARAAAQTGFFKDIDLVAVDVFPDDEPLGAGLDSMFSGLTSVVAGKRLMLGSFGGGDKPKTIGLYLPAGCAYQRSVCGGFWSSALEDMLSTKTGSDELLDAFHDAVRPLKR